MSLSIEVQKVTGILLPDGWHEVVPDSLWFDAFELIEPGDRYSAQPKAESTGISWQEPTNAGVAFYAPLTSLLAVRTVLG